MAREFAGWREMSEELRSKKLPITDDFFRVIGKALSHEIHVFRMCRDAYTGKDCMIYFLWLLSTHL